MAERLLEERAKPERRSFFSDIDVIRGVGILVGLGALAYCGLLIQKDARDSRLSTKTYQGLPAEVREYDNLPRDGYLSAEELTRYFKDFPLKSK